MDDAATTLAEQVHEQAKLYPELLGQEGLDFALCLPPRRDLGGRGVT